MGRTYRRFLGDGTDYKEEQRLKIPEKNSSQKRWQLFSGPEANNLGSVAIVLGLVAIVLGTVAKIFRYSGHHSRLSGHIYYVLAVR